MEAKYIETGTDAEFILGCEMSDVNGNHSGNPVMGAVGGPMG